MDCEILTKSGDFSFLGIDPSLFNLFKERCLDENDFLNKLKNGNNDNIIEIIIEEVNRTKKCEILVYDTLKELAYINSDGESILLNKDFCEKFNIRKLIPKNILNRKCKEDIKFKIFLKITSINNCNQIFFGRIGERFRHNIATALTNIINQYVSDRYNNYEELIKICETKFYNIESLYSMALEIIS